MDYSLIVSPRAQKEVEKAIEVYISSVVNTPNSFIIQLQSVYNTLKINPFFKVRYKNVRSLKLKKYPYSLYFVVNENRNTVRILSCFHNKLDPKKQPRF